MNRYASVTLITSSEPNPDDIPQIGNEPVVSYTRAVEFSGRLLQETALPEVIVTKGEKPYLKKNDESLRGRWREGCRNRRSDC